MKPILIGVVQLCSGLEPGPNLDKIRQQLIQAKEKGCSAVFLPECFYSLSDGQSPTPYLVKRGNEHYQAIQQLAVDFKMAILSGSAATLHEDGVSVVNRNFCFSPTGEELAFYDKIHLFQCQLKQDKTVLDESQIYQPGKQISTVKWEDFTIGQTICFDLRFPSQFQQYMKEAVNLFTVPSAFTRPTGQAHWHTLLRARAIETQSFVVAAAQWGKHNDRMSSFGHSLVVDPWGEILVDAGDGEKLITAQLDLELVAQARQKIPITR